MSRSILSNSGRSIVEKKLEALQRGCDKTMHADVNAPRNLRARRTRTFRASNGANAVRGYATKACVLRTLVHDFMRQCAEREKVGRRGTSRDPRPTNPYFKQFAGEELALVISSGHDDMPAAAACASKP